MITVQMSDEDVIYASQLHILALHNLVLSACQIHPAVPSVAVSAPISFQK